MRPAVALVAAVLAVAACSTDRRPEPLATAERTGTVAKALQAAQLDGSSLGAKQIALTFDDGPGSRTLELSAFLKAEGIKATFFINGHCFGAGNPCGNPGLTPAQVFTQVTADGHLVANHTQDHYDLTTQFPNGAAGDAAIIAELTDTDALIAPYVPNNRFLFRPPYGAWNARDYNVLHASAMDKYVGPVRWDIGGQMTGSDATGFAADWDCWQNQNGFGLKTTSVCAGRYMNEIHAVGHGISLMHDSDSGNMGNHNVNAGTGNTIDMVKLVLVPQLKAEGYTFVRADDVPAINAALPPPPCDASCTTCSGPAANQCTGCTDGKFLNAGTCTACHASCATCSGAGAGACTSCNGSRYLAGNTCSACTACAADKYEVSACTPVANTVCGACDATCATCSGAGPGACTSCKGGTYLNGQNCSACTVCGASQYQVTACSAGADTVCGACDASCTVCAGPNPDQCGACPADSYLGAGACHACTVCAAGTARTAACTATSNATCTACAPGKFSAAAGSTTCTSCAPGTFAASAGSKACTPCAAGESSGAGASACTTCGDCNDKDDCTTDTCDAANGCTHTRVAGCTPKDASTTVDAGGPPPAAAADAGENAGEGEDGGCNVAHSSRKSDVFLLALGALSMLAWRRRRPSAHSRAR